MVDLTISLFINIYMNPALVSINAAVKPFQEPLAHVQAFLWSR